jgi:hypothetical protein
MKVIVGIVAGLLIGAAATVPSGSLLSRGLQYFNDENARWGTVTPREVALRTRSGYLHPPYNVEGICLVLFGSLALVAGAGGTAAGWLFGRFSESIRSRRNHRPS